MQKQEIITNIAANTGLTEKEVSKVVENFIAEVKSALIKNEPVFIRGFGTFNPTQRKAKKGRNITKGVSVDIPAFVLPTFKPAEEFKKMCNQ